MQRLICMVSAGMFFATAALAFLPPHDEQGGVKVGIEGFDEEPNASRRLKTRELSIDQPLEIRFVVENKRKESVAGSFTCWMNDDWVLSETNALALKLSAGESRALTRIATAKPRVLDALYPIHAAFTFTAGSSPITVHPVAIFKAMVTNRPSPTASWLKAPRLGRGSVRLDQGIQRNVFITCCGQTRTLGENFSGSDAASGARLGFTSITLGGETKSGFSVHPPYQQGPGAVSADVRVILPALKPCSLSFSTALCQAASAAAKSDGVGYSVVAIPAGGEPKEIFTRVSDRRQWEPALVDVSDYAGRDVTFRFVTNPGPKNDTTCDGCFWGDLTLTIGPVLAQPCEADWRALEAQAVQLARKALASGDDPAAGLFRLSVRGERFGVAVVPGPQGLTDGLIAFADEKGALLYRGFSCGVDGQPIGAVPAGTPVFFTRRMEAGALSFRHTLLDAAATTHVVARARISSDGTALRIAWDMPLTRRRSDGTPRYSWLSLGSASLPVWRAYLGFGNVIEAPKNFRVEAGGFGLSTRHIGGDYTNGLSLVQASDLIPDCAMCKAEQNCFALVVPHDATFFFIPSRQGAFAAARAFQKISGYRAAPGVPNLIGKMCLDQWDGSYAAAARDLRRAARYGVTDAVFVKHVWQRWGYDYRLPEIFPPNPHPGTMTAFLEMRRAAAEAGIRFCPHDNYIDFYPDAEGYSYDHILFNADGTPQLAWYNSGARAQSYRWLPHAFRPRLEANMLRMRDSFAPDALFIDVFTAIAPMDYRDRAGRFYTRAQTVRAWGDAFNTCRDLLGGRAPMISEAGMDSLMGSIDAGEADHLSAGRWMPPSQFADAERVPWHDMASHQKMILLGGGLGSRYAAIDWNLLGDNLLHGCGSDDYLCNSVIGGRSPMAEGPFNRRAVMTYWLLHDISAALARQPFERHAFGPTIHQQHTAFADGGEVWSNRATNRTWMAAGRELPTYGFYAKAKGGLEAGILLINGQRAAFAASPDTFFADARPPYGAHSLDLESRVAGGRYDGAGKFTLQCEITVRAASHGFHPFVHILPLQLDTPILFQGNLALSPHSLEQTGTFTVPIHVEFPAAIPAGDYCVRYGFYLPDGNMGRMRIVGLTDNENRVKGGILHVEKKGSSFTAGAFTMETSPVNPEELNLSRRMLSFGPIRTDGAFRLVRGRPGFWKWLGGRRPAWELLPLPEGGKFRAEIDLAAWGAAGARVTAVESIEPLGETARAPAWSQNCDWLTLECDGLSTGYRISF